MPSLIDVVQKQLTNYQVFAKAKKQNIFITSGVQQALSILAVIPFTNNKKTILIEQPGYHLFIESLQALQVPVLGIKRTSKGIDLVELERLFREEIFFYTMPRYHNPLGTYYSQEEKKEILELAQKYNVFIVEDDYLADFEQNSKADPIYSYDDFTHVIYFKELLKSSSPD